MARSSKATPEDPVGEDQAPPAVVPGGGLDPTDLLARRLATVASTIAHDSGIYAPDAMIALTRVEFETLKGTGALADTDWDDLEQV
ncbi:MAG: hypothetical protein U1D35_11255 [Paracoccaceae bacterium]|nr:hypothetical protein [Paracoccaceae bacterium]